MKITMNDGTSITLKTKENPKVGEAPFEYYIGKTFCFGVIEPFPEEDIKRLYDDGYFDQYVKTSPKVKASMKYDKANVKQVKLSLNKKTDADVIAILDSKDNVQGYIKELIRSDNAKKSK